MDIISLLETPATPTIYNGTGSREVQLQLHFMHKLKKKRSRLLILNLPSKHAGISSTGHT